MPHVELRDLFGSPWGIVECRKDEIESGGYGVFDKILSEEIRKEFLSIDQVATQMDVHPSTARRWIADLDARFIIHEANKLYHKDDVARIIEKRKLAKEFKKAKQATA